MKKIILIAFYASITLVITEANAQQKMGYISMNYILKQIPEVESAEVDLNKMKAEFDTIFQGKVKTLQSKITDYEKSKASLSDLLKLDKEKELQNLQVQAEEFRKNANTLLQEKKTELGQPFLKKINEALQAVVKENGYKFIINNDLTQTSIFAYAPEDANISDLVLKKMGYKARVLSIDEPNKNKNSK